MRTTLNIDDTLYASASAYTGVKEKTALVRLALENLIEHKAYERLAALGGAMPDLETPPRRRSKLTRK
ncbi:MAG: type II toxin-antitoxin system VapB family antitoxin [Chthoniobacterales bacterium]